MTTIKWRIVLLCIILYGGKFYSTHGEPNVPIWSDQVETQLRVIPSKAPEIIDAKLFFDKKINALTVSLLDATDEKKEREKQFIFSFDKVEGISIVNHKCNPTETIKQENSDITFLENTPDGKRLKDFGSFFFFDSVKHAKQVPYDWNQTYGFEIIKWESINVNVNMFMFTVCNLTHYTHNIVKEENDGKIGYNSFAKIEAICQLEKESGENPVPLLSLTIDFFDYNNYISNTEVFQQPPGVYCSFLNVSENFPSLPPYFSFDFETFDSDNELDFISTVTFQRKAWYDSQNKLVRRDNLNRNLDATVTLIGDYNSRLSYIFLPSGECNINELKDTDTMETGILLPGANFPLFPGTTDYSPQYIGQRKRYGITFDVWVNRITYSETTEISEYYFTNNMFKEENTTSPVFIELFIFNSNEKLVGSALQLITDYHAAPSKRDQSTFDVTSCFPENNKTRFFLTFISRHNGSFETFDQIEFKNSVQEKLLSLLGVSKIRLGAPEIFFLNETSVILSSVLVEDPTRLGYEKGKNETSREKALKHLSEVVSELKFVISVDTPAGGVALTAVKLTSPYSQESDHKDKKDENKDTKKHQSDGFSSKTLAAVGIVMLIIGGLQGAILLVAYVRYRRSDPLVKKLTRSEETEQPNRNST